MAKDKSRICLNMIVKNESAVIERCLQSVANHIDYWVICDTGSTDGTQQMIRRFFDRHAVPGQLYEDPWKDFAHNRNLALQRAKDKADYILIIDADDYLKTGPDFSFRDLTADSYMLRMQLGSLVYFNTKLIRAARAWRWQGVLHEVLLADDADPGCCYYGDYVMKATRQGDRSQNPDKYKHDIKVLQQALQTDPGNTRYQFYLAQSYRDDKNFEQAVEHYTRRSTMGGWEEEVYCSLLEIARNQCKLGLPNDVVIESYLKAFTYRPQRLEALYEAVRLCRMQEKFALGYRLGYGIKEIKLPEDILFVEKNVYLWMFHDELSVCAINAKDYQQGAWLLQRLLESGNVPTDHAKRLESNLQFARRNLDRANRV